MEPEFVVQEFLKFQPPYVSSAYGSRGGRDLFLDESVFVNTVFDIGGTVYFVYSTDE